VEMAKAGYYIDKKLSAVNEVSICNEILKIVTFNYLAKRFNPIDQIQ
jgi:hypothetical protein